MGDHVLALLREVGLSPAESDQQHVGLAIIAILRTVSAGPCRR
jgi:hypothetical protein